MAKRHSDALLAWSGACNPIGLTHGIVKCYQEIMAEPGYRGTNDQRSDPAARVMVYQLAYLMGFEPMAFDIGEAVADCQHALESAVANENPPGG